MIEQVRAQLAHTINETGAAFTTNGTELTGINSPFLQLLVTCRDFDAVKVGGTISNANGAEFIVMAWAWHGDVLALTLLPKTALAQ